MLAYHFPALTASNEPHINPNTNFYYIRPGFLIFPYPAHSPHFPWPTIRNFQHLNHVHHVCAGSYAVGCMFVCSVTVVTHSASHCVLTAASMTRMTSLTYIVLVSFVCNLVSIVEVNHNGQDDITLIGCQLMWFAVQNIGLAYLTLAHG